VGSDDDGGNGGREGEETTEVAVGVVAQQKWFINSAFNSLLASWTVRE